MTEFELHDEVHTAESQSEYAALVDRWAIPLIRKYLPSVSEFDLAAPVQYEKLFRMLALHGVTTKCEAGAEIIGQPKTIVYQFLRGGLILSELKIALKFE